MLAGMVLGSIVAFILMRKFYASAIAAGVGAVLVWIGLIHASEVQWAAQPEVALGYAMLGIVLVAFAFHKRAFHKRAFHKRAFHQPSEAAEPELDPEIPSEA